MSTPIAQPTFPATIAAGATWDSGLIGGAYKGMAIVLAGTLDQAGVMTVTRYADAAGNAAIDQQTNQFVQAGENVVQIGGDNVPFCAFRLQITNSNASVVANLSNAVLRAA